MAHLHRDVGSAAQPRAVDLRDRRGAQRLGIDPGEQPRAAEAAL